MNFFKAIYSLQVLINVLILLPDTPEKSVEGMLNSFKNGDFTSVNKYVIWSLYVSFLSLEWDFLMRYVLS